MPKGTLLRLIAAAGGAVGAAAYFRYRTEISNLTAELERGGTIAHTAMGAIEYAEAGAGQPFLMVHGAGGGYDQGMLLGQDLGAGYRVIAPSRFAYLRTPVPKDASPAAQGDAHAALLDHLGVGKAIVLGASAGAPSVIELALRHPDRLSALILLVPRTYHPDQTVSADSSLESQAVLQLVQTAADCVFWLATKLSRRPVVRFLGVPPELEAQADQRDRARVSQIIRSILPLSSRVQGIAVDTAAEVGPWPLARISCPVLVISAEDDLYGTLPGATFTAAGIPEAELHVLASGGHLMVGQSERVEEIVRDFLRRQ